MDNLVIVVETPKGSCAKYAYDEKEKAFTLTKVLPLGMVFPYDFGYVPDTKGQDGDPLDVLLLAEFGTFAGCRVPCRLIGAIKAEQTEHTGEAVENDRLIAVPVDSISFAHIKEIGDVSAEVCDHITRFFVNYNELAGKKFKPTGIIGTTEALEKINRSKEK